MEKISRSGFLKLAGACHERRDRRCPDRLQ